jgi:anti-sigma B factor antagonist
MAEWPFSPTEEEPVMNLIINSRTPNETTCILAVEGEVDVYTSPQLKQEIVQRAEAGVKHLIINLSKVEYLDSTGLGVLIGGLKRLREVEGNMALVGPGMRILRIFEITGLDKIFDIYQSEEEAAAKEGVSL